MRILLNWKIKGKNNHWVLFIYLLDTDSFSLKCQLSKQWMIIIYRGHARHGQARWFLSLCIHSQMQVGSRGGEGELEKVGKSCITRVYNRMEPQTATEYSIPSRALLPFSFRTNFQTQEWGFVHVKTIQGHDIWSPFVGAAL